eukprot:3209067-Rhodomonas_salina.1
MEWQRLRIELDSEEYAFVHTRIAHVELLTADVDIYFIMSSFSGDVSVGLGRMLSISTRRRRECSGRRSLRRACSSRSTSVLPA